MEQNNNKLDINIISAGIYRNTERMLRICEEIAELQQSLIDATILKQHYVKLKEQYETTQRNK